MRAAARLPASKVEQILSRLTRSASGARTSRAWRSRAVQRAQGEQQQRSTGGSKSMSATQPAPPTRPSRRISPEAHAAQTRKIHAYVATGRAKHPAETTRKVGGEMTQNMRQKLIFSQASQSFETIDLPVPVDRRWRRRTRRSRTLYMGNDASRLCGLQAPSDSPARLRSRESTEEKGLLQVAFLFAPISLGKPPSRAPTALESPWRRLPAGRAGGSLLTHQQGGADVARPRRSGRNHGAPARSRPHDHQPEGRPHRMARRVQRRADDGQGRRSRSRRHDLRARAGHAPPASAHLISAILRHQRSIRRRSHQSRMSSVTRPSSKRTWTGRRPNWRQFQQ